MRFGPTLFAAGLIVLQAVVEARNPVILVNGLGGSQLVANINIPANAAPHSYCKTKGTETLWSNPLYFIPGYVDCYNYFTTMTFNEATGVYSDATGVTISTVDFGGVSGTISGYFNTMISSLTGQLGYVAGKDLHGAPYDWRLGNAGLTQRGYFKNVQNLVEDTYKRNGNSPVVFITHSMGGPVILEFLNQMTQEWKNTHVSKFIALAPPFGGSFDSVVTAVNGYNFGIPSTKPQDYLTTERRQESVPWLFPRVGPTAWDKDEVVVTTPSKKYTASQFEALYKDISDPISLAIYKAVENSTLKALKAPNVNTYVFYGTGSKTQAKATYSYDLKPGYNPLSPSRIDYEDGDDTVATRSAKRGQIWSTEHAANGFVLQQTEFKGTSHVGFVSDSTAIRNIISILSAKTQETSGSLRGSTMAEA